jgi:hypothetical protein
VLDDVPADHAIHDTRRGREARGEARVETTTGAPHRLTITVSG